MHKLSKKASALTVAAVLGVSGGAYAYWTNTGSGTGTAETGTNAAVEVVQTSVNEDLYPGGPAQTLAGNFNNPNDGATYVTAVTATGYTIDSASVTAGCTVAGGHYTLGGTAPVNANVAAGDGVGAWTGLTITMNNLGTNQDFCKNAVLTITYASS